MNVLSILVSNDFEMGLLVRMNKYTLVLAINILSMLASYDFEMGLREGMGGHYQLAQPYLGPRIILLVITD